ncbi:MAG: acetylxylan esterase [Planctomycetaceae bacterium]|nr:acetylxylan esterase [Planctomycetaceae bacterium]
MFRWTQSRDEEARVSEVAPFADSQLPASEPFADLRRKFRSKLLRHTPSPDDFALESPPEGVRQIAYRSGDLELNAWYAVPETLRDQHPAVVYFHSGHAFGAADFQEAQIFLEAGFAVLTPMLRGENGNPGDFELWLGEVEDAANAIRWIADQPEIDANHIYAFGHSVGGGISAMLSLQSSDLPLRHSASCGGIYSAEVLQAWGSEHCPFDPEDELECRMRLLAPNIEWMARQHLAFVGVYDPLDLVSGNLQKGKLKRIRLLGDHFTSLQPAMREYVKVIHAEAFGAASTLLPGFQPIRWQSPSEADVQSFDSQSPVPEVWEVHTDPPPGKMEFYPWDIGQSIGVFFGKKAYTTTLSLDRNEQVFVDLESLCVVPRSEVEVPGTIVDEPWKWPLADQQPPAGSESWASPSDMTQQGIRRVARGQLRLTPGRNFVAGINSTPHSLVVWDAHSGAVAGRVRLPEPLGSKETRIELAELGISPDGHEIAALINGADSSMHLINWHLSHGRVTAMHTFKKYALLLTGSDRKSYNGSSEMRLGFLDAQRGWLLFKGSIFLDRQTGHVGLISNLKSRYVAWPGGRIIGVHRDRISGQETFGIFDAPNITESWPAAR